MVEKSPCCGYDLVWDSSDEGYRCPSCNEFYTRESLREIKKKRLEEEDFEFKRKTQPKIRCYHCHHKWHPRVRYPQKCPKCNRRLKW